MKLGELETTFIRDIDAKTFDRGVADFSEARGVMFLCPKCFIANRGRVGTHSVIAWFTGVPADRVPGPGRWEASGTSLADLTLRPSILLTGEGCGWHGFITNGEVITA